MSGEPDPLDWTLRRFRDLSVEELYEVMEIRQRVFVVEQNCAYLDADGRDREAWHLLGRIPSGRLAAVLRILPPGIMFAEPSIGRVLTDPKFRSRGYGRSLMREGIRRCCALYPGQPIRISAQAYLERFYGELGFETDRKGNPYEVDGIPHIDMLYRRGE